MYAVIKADDCFFAHGKSDKWKRYLERLQAESVPTSVGFIARDLYNGANVDHGLVDMVVNGGGVEVWNHGVKHQRTKQGVTDFFGRSYLEQKQSLDICSGIAAEQFGHRPMGFGPPYNMYDSKTVKAVAESPSIRYSFDIPYIPGKRCFPLAYSTHADGSGKSFNLKTAKRRSVRDIVSRLPLVVQVHPGTHWASRDLDQFILFVRALQASGYLFILPSDALALLRI